MCSGYPEKHKDCDTYTNDLKYLKAKVDAGADLIITQLCYDAKTYLKFIKDCRDIGIMIPILPGLMPIRSYGGLKRMCTLCGAAIPKYILDYLEPFKDNDEAVQDYGVKQCVEMCRELIDGGVKWLHFCTLNMEKSVRLILLELGLINDSHLHRDVPWAGARPKGKGEAVRPIFWANRPKTYIARTRDWDSFPNGRWGDAGSPAFETLGSYHVSGLYTKSVETRINHWGNPTQVQQVCDTFVSYLNGQIDSLPWNDTPLSQESNLINDQLKRMNAKGFLTINSQPKVNGVPSDDPIHGWGGPRGYVYQKAYIEFFTSPENWTKLEPLFPKFPTLDYQAVNSKEAVAGNLAGTAAVTWGVWPGSEIKQPTVVDPMVFATIWKDEAFALWHTQWASLYDASSESWKVIEKMASTYVLVNIIDNDYVKGNIFSIFEELLSGSQS